jgi:hypothetical protein
VLGKLMNKKNAILRAASFVCVYLLFYAMPLIVLLTAPLSLMKHLPRLVGNLCFFLPQYAFPFDRLILGYNPHDGSNETVVFNDHIALLISGIYLLLLGALFSFLSRSVRKIRWTILLAFFFSILSITLLNVVLWICGITVSLDGP